MGVPGWPDFACWTASMQSVRMVLTHSRSRSCGSAAVIPDLAEVSLEPGPASRRAVTRCSNEVDREADAAQTACRRLARQAVAPDRGGDHREVFRTPTTSPLRQRPSPIIHRKKPSSIPVSRAPPGEKNAQGRSRGAALRGGSQPGEVPDDQVADALEGRVGWLV